MRKRDVAVQAIAMILALVVGILLGRSCEPTPDKVVETVTVTEVGPERIVYECPPDAGMAEPPKPATSKKKARAQKKKPDTLPPASEPITPAERKRLLGWVRDQSVDLEGCRSGAKETYRLAVTLRLTKEGAVDGVRINAPPEELPSQAQSCLRDRMASWIPPAELVKDRRELVFGLTF